MVSFLNTGLLSLPLLKMGGIPIAGPLVIQPFGLLVATGVMLGYSNILKWAKKDGFSEEKIQGAIQSVLIPGFIGSHIFEILFYQWERLLQEGPLVLLKVWDGISSYGGFLGAFIGFGFYSYRVLGKDTLKVADWLIHGLVIGWIFGRTGCTLVGDHPGEITDSPLGFQFADGVRHNLGFYELVFTFAVLFPAATYLSKKKQPPGVLSAWICILYAPVRFGLDFMRAVDREGADTRYLGLTFAHYCSIALFIFCVFLLRRIKKQANTSS